MAASSFLHPSSHACTQAHHQPSFSNTVVICSAEVVCSNLTSFGGTTVVQGRVIGDVVSFGGSVVIDGDVEGDITLYGGALSLQDGAHVMGDIHICGGQWNEGKALQFHRNIFDCTKSVSLLFLSNGGPNFRFWYILIWLALAVLLITLLPEHLMLVRTTVESKMQRSLALGLLSMLLAPTVLVILVALIIAIPLAIIVAAGFLAAWILGTVAVGWLVGEYILRKVAPQYNARPVQIVVGIAVLALAGSLPYIGWLISIGAGMVGLGAVFLSRFGTRLYTQPRHPLSL